MAMNATAIAAIKKAQEAYNIAIAKAWKIRDEAERPAQEAFDETKKAARDAFDAVVKQQGAIRVRNGLGERFRLVARQTKGERDETE